MWHGVPVGLSHRGWTSNLQRSVDVLLLYADAHHALCIQWWQWSALRVPVPRKQSHDFNTGAHAFDMENEGRRIS